MTDASISTLKNHLPEMVHLVEQGEDIQITRHGKPVAVLVSLERYQQAFAERKGVFHAWQRWRKLHPETKGFSDAEQAKMYERTREPYADKTNSWD